jgi:iron complex transport system permease protein
MDLMNVRTLNSKATLSLLAFMAVVAVLAAGLCGASGCAIPSSTTDMMWLLRMPRALSAFAVGASLALSGALMQLLLRNPLADPYVLGISGGAAAGALGLTWLLPATLMTYGLHVGALVGALLATALLFGLAYPSLINNRQRLNDTQAGLRLILTGVMIAAASGALITLLLSLSDDASLRGALFWLMGDLDTIELIWPVWLMLALAMVWSIRNAAALNVLSHGELTAFLLGVPTQQLRITTLLVAAFTTAAAVSVAGTIGFIGLVVPHALRLVVGNDQRVLLPSSVLVGGAVLCVADLIARSIAAPVQLPVGVITSLVGVPVFLMLLTRSR